MGAQGSAVDLEACPFCGTVETGGTVMDATGLKAVWCDNCRAYGPEVHGEEEAIAAWNRRPTPTYEQGLAEGHAKGIEAAAKYHDDAAANAAIRFGELNRWSDCADERAGWRSWKDKNDLERYYAACIRSLGPDRG